MSEGTVRASQKVFICLFPSNRKIKDDSYGATRPSLFPATLFLGDEVIGRRLECHESQTSIATSHATPHTPLGKHKATTHPDHEEATLLHEPYESGTLDAR